MSARPSSFRRGGGFLNEVDAVIRDYQWTDEFNGEPFKPGKFKRPDGKAVDRPHSLNFFLSARVEGATEDTTVTLKAAPDFDNFEVSEDGHVLTSADGGECSLSANSQVGKFITSLCEAGAIEGTFSEAELSDDPNSVDVTPIIGLRVRFRQRNYSAEELEAVKRLGAPEKRKGKDGKEYSRQTLVVDQVYEREEVQAAKPATRRGISTSTAKPVTRSNGKVTKSVEPDAVDVAEEASAALIGYVAATKSAKAPNGALPKAKVRVKVLTDPAFKDDTDLRDEVYKWLASDKNLEAIDGVEYDKTDKNQVISLSAS